MGERSDIVNQYRKMLKKRREERYKTVMFHDFVILISTFLIELTVRV